MSKYSINDHFVFIDGTTLPMSIYQRSLFIIQGEVVKVVKILSSRLYQVESQTSGNLMILSTYILERYTKRLKTKHELDLEKEDKILKDTAAIWDTFNNMNMTHPSDKDDMAKAIHNIQSIIAVRMARRANPERFISYVSCDQKKQVL